MSMSSEISTTSKQPLRVMADLSSKQQDAIDALYSGNKLLIASMGFGKAVVGQTAAQELIESGVLNRVLVLAPLKVCQLTWGSEWEKWEHLNPVEMAIGDEFDRMAAVASGAPIVCMNFDNVAWLFNRYTGRQAQFPFDGLLVDESTKLKAVGGEAFKAMRNHLKRFTWRCGMTADPVAEIGVDIYSQALLVDNGRALGRNLEAFRRKYFYPSDYQQRKWSILPGKDKALADVLQDVLYVVRDTEYADALPELRDVIVPVEMPPEAWGLYNALDDGFLDIGAGVIADTAALVKGKQQQITAGAVYDSPADPKLKRAHWIHTAKLAALEGCLAMVHEPVAIAYCFQFELDALRERWPDIAVLGDDPVAAERDWTAGRIRLLAVHPASCSHGLNLQYGGFHLMVLSMPWGADPWEQLIGRFRRRGQPSAFVQRTIFVVNDTVDNEILARHAQKAYASETLNDAFDA
jgi:hypothetical protein